MNEELIRELGQQVKSQQQIFEIDKEDGLLNVRYIPFQKIKKL